MALVIILFACVAALSAIFYYSQYNFDYWKKRNVPYPKPLPLFGNYKDYILLKSFITEAVNDICKQFPKAPYIGAFMGPNPILIVKDPEYIKLILTKDFYYFNSREISDHVEKEESMRNLFSTYGDHWKVLRQNVTPLFSLSKMKKMFYLIADCTQSLDKLIDTIGDQSSVEIRSIMSRYTVDCIGSCVFGINTKSMSLDQTQNPFLEIGKTVFEASKSRGARLVGRSLWPNMFYKLGFKLFPLEVPEFFHNLMSTVFAQRSYKNSGRHDFIDYMLNLRSDKIITGDSISSLKGDAKKVSMSVDDELLAAQCFIFFAAGYETTSTTSSFLLFNLAKNLDKQQRVHEEIDEYFKKHEKLEYDTLNELSYLEACVNESLRIYPLMGVLTREVVEDYRLPSGVVLEKDLRIHIPVHHIQHNPEYFPEPELFRPERFLGGEKEKIKSFTYMPFGEGPRTCIGMRFARMQILAGLSTLLRKVRVEIGHDTNLKIDLEPTALTSQPVNGIKLKLIKREAH